MDIDAIIDNLSPAEQDTLEAFGNNVLAADLKRENAPGKVWLDYAFISACYFATLGKNGSVDLILQKIKEEAPDYDPSVRFAWDCLPDPDPAKFDDPAENEKFEEFRYRAPVIGQMNKFCTLHPDFQFSVFSQYFPGTLNMKVKPGAEEGLIAGEDGTYRINQSLHDEPKN
jgi:hypothetical protein